MEVGAGVRKASLQGACRGGQELVNTRGGLARQRKEGGASAKALRPEFVEVLPGAIELG